MTISSISGKPCDVYVSRDFAYSLPTVSSDEPKKYTYEDETGVSAYYYINSDGSYNNGYISKSNKGSTNITVSGEVIGDVFATANVAENNIKIDVKKGVDGSVSASSVENAKATITVGGAADGYASASASGDKSEATVSATGNSKGASASATGESAKAETTVGGDSEGYVYASSGKNASSTVTVGGNVSYENKQDYWSDVYAVNASTTDGTTKVDIAGDASVKNDSENYSETIGIKASTNGENSDLKVHVGGDLTAESKSTSQSEYNKSKGITSTNKGGKIDISVDGDVNAEGTGISAQSAKSSTNTDLRKEEDIAEFKDKAKLVSTDENGNKYYTYKDEENGISVEYYINADGTFNSGTKTITKANKGSTEISVAGGVTGSVSASANASENNVEIDIKKDVEGTVSASSVENAKATVTVGGDADGDVNAKATGAKSDSKVTIEGSNKGANANASGESAKATITVGDDADGYVSSSASEDKSEAMVSVAGNSQGAGASAMGESAKAETTVGGDSEGYVYASSGKNASSTVTVGGDVSYESKQDYRSNDALNASTTDGTTKVDIAGDVSVKNNSSNSSSTTGIRASTDGDNSDLKVHVGGDLTAESNSTSQPEYNKSRGIISNNKGGKIDISVDGDVIAEITGISAQSEESSRDTYLNKEEDIAEFKDKAELVSTDEYGNKYYRYKDEESGISAYYYINADGTFNYGNKTTTKAYKGSTEISVTGGVTGNVSASANVSENNVDIDIKKDAEGTVLASSAENAKATVTVGGDADGDVNAKATGEKSDSEVTIEGSSKGANASASGESAKATITVGGNADGYASSSASGDQSEATVTVAGDSKGAGANATGKSAKAETTVGGDSEGYVYASSAKNASSTVTVGGDVSYENKQDSSSDAYAVNASTTDGTTKVDIAGDASVKNNSSNSSSTTGIRASTDGENSDLTIHVGGDLTAESNSTSQSEYNKARGIISTNKGGKIDISVDGDVTAEGTGISAQSEVSSRETYLNKEEDIAEFKDKAELVSTDEQGRKYYRYQDEENGISVYYYIKADGTFDYGNKTITKAYKGSTEISVTGGVTGNVSASAKVAENNVDIDIKKDVDGTVSASSVENAKATVTVGGNVNGNVRSEATGTKSDSKVTIEGSSKGANASASGESAKATITVGGNADGYASSSASGDKSEATVTVEGDSKGASASATGESAKAETTVGGDSEGYVYASSAKNASSTVTVGGNVNYEYESENENSSTINAVKATASDGTIKINVAGDVTVNNKSNNGSANGIKAESTGEESELDVYVGGNLEAIGNESSENSYKRAKAVDAENHGSKMSIDIVGDVKSSYDGIHLKNYGTYNKSMSQEEFEAIRDIAEYKNEGSDGSKRYEYKDDAGNQYSFYVNADGTFRYGNATLVIEKENETEFTVGGSIEATNSGLRTSNANGDMKVTVGKDITVSSEDENDTVMGVQSLASGGGTRIDIGGDVMVSTEGYYAVGVDLDSSDEDSVTDFNLKGSVIATANGKEQKNTEDESYPHRDVDGVYIDNDAGTINATIGGDVISNMSGVSVNHDRTYDHISLTDEDVARIFDKATKEDGGTAEDDDGVIHERAFYTYEDEDGYTYEFTMVDGKLDWGNKTKLLNKNASTNLEIDGQINVKSDGKATGLYTEIDNGEINVDVKGGIFVEGSASLGDEWNDRVYIDGVRAVAYGDNSKLTISVVGGITNISNTLADEDNGSAISVSNHADDTGVAEVNISVEGDVESTGTGIYMDSGDKQRKWLEGTAEIKEEDYLMTTKSVNGDGEVVEEKIYYNEAGGFYYNEAGEMWEEIDPETGFTKIKVIGDVHGENIGINIDNGDHTDIIVDGTVSGGESAILINNEIIDEDMMLTVWEVQPDEDGNIVERIVGYDADGNPIYAQDKEIEKQLQYIIRIEPTQFHMIDLEGTTEYEGYRVAHEGDTVTLKLNIPAGYALDGAYGDLGQEYQLLKDASGNYYLVVPRGGAVLLSLKMHRVAAQTVKIKYDPNGGVVDGHDSLYSLSTYKNKELTLPTPDEREGYEFVGWYKAEFGRDSERWTDPSEDDANILKAGTTFKADRNYTCTAIWKTK